MWSRSLAAAVAACALFLAGSDTAHAKCKPSKYYPNSAGDCLKRVDRDGKDCCKSVRRNRTKDGGSLGGKQLDHIADLVARRRREILEKYPDTTLNHVAARGFYEGNKRAGLLPSTAQVCLRYGTVGGAGKDDITKGIGYYHFNRVSVGNMCAAPNFPLSPGKLQYFIDPSILFDRHFIVCKGNIALTDCMMDKLESLAGKHTRNLRKRRKSLEISGR